MLVPDILDVFTNLSNITGFEFSAFFESGGIAGLVLSVALLIGIFGYLGFKVMGSSKR